MVIYRYSKKQEEIKMKQKFSSANTSINSTKLPAVYKKIDWKAIKGGANG